MMNTLRLCTIVLLLLSVTVAGNCASVHLSESAGISEYPVLTPDDNAASASNGHATQSSVKSAANDPLADQPVSLFPKEPPFLSSAAAAAINNFFAVLPASPSNKGSAVSSSSAAAEEKATPASFPSVTTSKNDLSLLSEKAVPFADRRDLASLADLITKQRLVLLGEASHGTSEFYTKRSFLSKYLTEKKGFNFIAVEGDWASFARINEFVKHKAGGPSTLEEAMESVTRWPLWMWRNQEFARLVEWLHTHNADLPAEERIGLYGIDVYDHEASMEDVAAWIRTLDRSKGRKAEKLFSCMSRHDEPADYLRMVARTGQDCSEDIAEVLEIVRSLEDHPGAERWSFFRAEQGAKVAIHAELHYRSNLFQGSQAWNYRAYHFYLTAERLLNHYGEDSRGIIWAHNTHIGDARATDMALHNMYNIGQLSRERLGKENVFAIGFGTYTGNVFAGSEWGDRRQAMRTPAAQPGSWEHTLEQTGYSRFYLDLRDEELTRVLSEPIPHRAIGVTYNPADEQNNYIPTILPDRYDAFIFIRETGELTPLD